MDFRRGAEGQDVAGPGRGGICPKHRPSSTPENLADLKNMNLSEVFGFEPKKFGGSQLRHAW